MEKRDLSTVATCKSASACKSISGAVGPRAAREVRWMELWEGGGYPLDSALSR